MHLFSALSFAFAFMGWLGGWGNPPCISANEMAGLGIGAAALIGGIGYLFIRRRGDS